MLRGLMLDLPTPSPLPANEPILSYAPGSPERVALKGALASMAKEQPDVPHVVAGQESREGATYEVRAPHDHALLLATCHDGGHAVTERAISAALAAAPAWSAMPFAERARVFLRAADLLAGPWRQILNAATMLGQSKTAYQAEIDAACELIDFLRFNVAFGSRLAEHQPVSPQGFLNTLELRPLEGFVLAVTPFNFTAIAGNLPTSCALMGNVVVWKPAENQSLAAYHTMKLFEAAGLPPGVINVVYGDGAKVAETCLAHRELAGVHFTGSTRVFQSIWSKVGANIASYKSYPRLVGETGGKDFVFAHPSAEVEALAVALVRGAFEFQGQKCSAASRAYVPRSLWPRVRDLAVAHIEAIAMGDVTDFRNFMGAVINERAWTRLSGWRDRLKADSGVKMIADKGWSRERGWFCGPTLAEVSDPAHLLLAEELFGPVLAVHVYDDDRPTGVDDALTLVDRTSPYGLTGAVFARDRGAVATAVTRLRQAAGNMYVNDKPTGAVVGQQPFGGGRASGTNDKAGSAFNLLRWASPRVVKETFVPSLSVGYPFMGAE
jgi:1-pyrroline-5-carboxylate dehydrogenase